MDQKDHAYIFGIALVVCLALAPVFAGRFFAAGDTRDIFIPLETFFHEQQIKFSLPSWNPNISWGFPVIASAQIGFFYPPLLLTRFMPIWFYLPLNLIAHLVFAAFGTYLFLRKLNRSPSASCLGAISFTLGAFVFQHLTHLNVIFALAWFPWQLLAAQYIAPQVSNFLSSRRGRLRSSASGGLSERKSFDAESATRPTFSQALTGKPVAFLALALGIPFLAGQIQIPFLIASVSAVYFLWLTWQHTRKIVRPLGIIFLSSLLAFGLAAVQLLPTAELAWYSTRGKDNDFAIERANQYSWPLYHAPTLLFPRFFGNDTTYWGKGLQVEYGIFIGTLPLLLALYTLCKIRDRSLRFWKWTAIISFLLALGSLSPFRLIGLEPSLWIFSGPARWLLFTTFSLAVLAAYGWDHRRPMYIFFRNIAAVTLGVIILTNVALLSFSDSSLQMYAEKITETAQKTYPAIFAKDGAYYINKITSLLQSLRTSSISLASAYTFLPLALLISIPLLLKRGWDSRLLLALAITELVIIAATTNPTLAWRNVLSKPETVNQLPAAVQHGQARLHSLRSFEDIGAFLTTPENRPADRLHNEPRRLLLPLIHAQFGLPGVAWPASLDLAAQSEVLQKLNETLKQGDVAVAEAVNVGAIIKESSEVQTLNPKPRASLILPDGQEIPADYQELSPTQTQIQTSSDEGATLIVRDTFYPGWDAFLDGQFTPIEKYDIFRAISVPAGSHTVVMRYEPGPLMGGMALSALALVVCLVMMYKRANL